MRSRISETLMLVLLAATAASAQTRTDSQREAFLAKVVPHVVKAVPVCGPALLQRFGLTYRHVSLSFAVHPQDHGRAVAGVYEGDTSGRIVLFERFFDLDERKAALALIHEWLHTQGLTERGEGLTRTGPTDREITQAVNDTCTEAL